MLCTLYSVCLAWAAHMRLLPSAATYAYARWCVRMWTCVQVALRVHVHVHIRMGICCGCGLLPLLCLSARAAAGHTAFLPSAQEAGVAHVNFATVHFEGCSISGCSASDVRT